MNTIHFLSTALLCISNVFTLTSLYAQTRSVNNSFATRSETLARNGMAATSHSLATETALHILRKGGSAVDAAIAANAVVGVIEPTGNGIGGDIFAVVWDAETKRLYGLDGSGRSPKSLTFDCFEKYGIGRIASLGPLAVSVPGCVDGWYTLHSRFGRMPMKELLQPAIQYAREGYPVTDVIATRWAQEVPRRLAFPGFKETFTLGGRAPKAGELFQNPDLAHTLEKIAEGGRDVYYKGEIARTIDSFMKDHKGLLSYEDLAAHRSDWIEPVSTNYRGYDVWEMPGNNYGIAVLEMLNLLESYDVAGMGFGSTDYIHLFAEAAKIAYEDCIRYAADEDFNHISLETLISKVYANERGKRIDMSRAAQGVDDLILNEEYTIYITAGDKEGNMVALIQSDYGGMGSGMVPDGLGFGLHNRVSMLDMQNRSHVNALESGNRPFPAMTLGFVTKKGRPFMSLGLIGGVRQPQGHVQMLVNMIDFGMNVQEASDALRINQEEMSPRRLHMRDGGALCVAHDFDHQVIHELIARGHQVVYGRPEEFGGYHGIVFDSSTGVYHGASESRKNVYTAGF